jgi:hypothetical protein
MRFRITALIGSTTERKARISRTRVNRITKASTYGNFPYTAWTKSRSSGAVPPRLNLESGELE